jgi:hypothetical protein
LVASAVAYQHRFTDRVKKEAEAMGNKVNMK